MSFVGDILKFFQLNENYRKNQEMVTFCFLKHVIGNTFRKLSNLFSGVNNVKDNLKKSKTPEQPPCSGEFPE